jgi:hypothetical protein
MTRSNTSLAAVAILARSASANASDWRDVRPGGQANLTGYGIDQEEVAGNALRGFWLCSRRQGIGDASGRSLKAVSNTDCAGQVRFQCARARILKRPDPWCPRYRRRRGMDLRADGISPELAVGLEDGAADSAGIYAPTVSDINRLDDARAFALRNPLETGFDPFTPNGAHIRTDLSASGNASKAIDHSPRLIGIQLSASYTPELSRGLNELFSSSQDTDRQADIGKWALVQGSLSAFDVGVYAGYVKGYNEGPRRQGPLQSSPTPSASQAPRLSPRSPSRLTISKSGAPAHRLPSKA